MELSLWSIAFLTGLFSGSVSVLIAFFIEKLGGRIGGVIGGSPTVVVVAMVGLYYATANMEDDVDSEGRTMEPLRRAAFGIPMGTCMNSAMFFVWRAGILHYRNVGRVELRVVVYVALCALAFWVTLTTLSVVFSQVVLIGLMGYDVAVPGLLFLALNLLSGLIQAFPLARPSIPSSAQSTPWILYICRFSFSFIVVGSCIIIAEIASPLLSGVISAFPAIFVTVTATTWYNSGADVILGAIGPLSLSVVSVALYGILSYYLFLSLGPILGSIIAYFAVTLLYNVPVAALLSLRKSMVYVNENEIELEAVSEERCGGAEGDDHTDRIGEKG